MLALLDLQLFPEQASTFAGKVDALYFFSLAVTAFFTLLIFAGVLFLFIKYRRKSEDEVGAPIHGSLTLEIIWSVIPFLVTMVLFAWGAQVFYVGVTTPEGAREYLATGKQWMWKFQHPEGHREINTLHVPVGETIKLTMTSEDVIHSFFVPAFRVKQDVLPGRYTQVWFEATKTGEYHLFCTEYCGAEHAQMIGTVYVMEPDEYQEWLDGGLVIASSPAASGKELFHQYACNTCHEAQGDTRRGPSLSGIAGDEVVLSGGKTRTRDDNYLRESILRPSSNLVDGYQNLMPTYQGQISEEGLGHLIAYIKGLDQDVDTTAEAEAAESGDFVSMTDSTGVSRP
ncbi:MAG: cytochrome c oxidase subunit II [Acidobacteriota bacterium]